MESEENKYGERRESGHKEERCMAREVQWVEVSEHLANCMYCQLFGNQSCMTRKKKIQKDGKTKKSKGVLQSREERVSGRSSNQIINVY